MGAFKEPPGQHGQGREELRRTTGGSKGMTVCAVGAPCSHAQRAVLGAGVGGTRMTGKPCLGCLRRAGEGQVEGAS